MTAAGNETLCLKRSGMQQALFQTCPNLMPNFNHEQQWPFIPISNSSYTNSCKN